MIRKKIWYELSNAKFYTIYANSHLLFNNSILKFLDIIAVAFSGIGIMQMTFWKEFPNTAMWIIMTVNLLKVLRPYIFLSDKQILYIKDIINFYNCHYNNLERFWVEYESQSISEESAINKFYFLKEEENSILKITNEAFNYKIPFIAVMSRRKTTTFLKYNFYE